MNTDNMELRCELYAIEGWRMPEGWMSNQEFFLTMFPAEWRDLTPRRLLAMLRRDGYLTESSKGKVSLETFGMDPETLQVTARGTGEPLFDVRVYAE